MFRAVAQVEPQIVTGGAPILRVHQKHPLKRIAGVERLRQRKPVDAHERSVNNYFALGMRQGNRPVQVPVTIIRRRILARAREQLGYGGHVTTDGVIWDTQHLVAAA